MMQFNVSKCEILTYLSNTPLYLSLEEVAIRRVLHGILSGNLEISEKYSVLFNGTIEEVCDLVEEK